MAEATRIGKETIKSAFKPMAREHEEKELGSILEIRVSDANWDCKPLASSAQLREKFLQFARKDSLPIAPKSSMKADDSSQVVRNDGTEAETSPSYRVPKNLDEFLEEPDFL